MKKIKNMKKYEVTHKDGKTKEILNETEIPKFSSTFNRMIKELIVGQEMYEITEMVNIKRVE